MLDRRQGYRGRVYYGGRIAFNERRSTMECIVRNFSPIGAKLEFVNPTILPAQFDLMLRCRGVAYLASVVWRRGAHCGVEFREARSTGGLPLDIALRDRVHQRITRTLRREIENLRGFG